MKKVARTRASSSMKALTRAGSASRREYRFEMDQAVALVTRASQVT